MRKLNIAIVGATGLVGKTLLTLLAEREFPIEELFLFGGEKSEGKLIEFKKVAYRVNNVADFDFSRADIAFFAASNEISAQYAPMAAEQGCIVIDKSSVFRLVEDIPLVIPEVNKAAIGDYINRHIIASPNCSTIQLLVALKPIYDAVGITRINVATYQAVSGTGKKAMAELIKQSGQMLNGRPPEPSVYPRPIAFNVLPHCDAFLDNGYTAEEMKLHFETQKILNDKDIGVNATAVRVPVLYGHSEAVNIETVRKVTVDMARQLLSDAPGVEVLDDPALGLYPTPQQNCVEEDAVFVGRIREDISHPLGLSLWIVADNMRKGAALNAIQIAEVLQQEYL